MACTKCGMENEYHNGLEYECPDCDHTWDDGLNLFDQNDEYDDEYDDEDNDEDF